MPRPSEATHRRLDLVGGLRRWDAVSGMRRWDGVRGMRKWESVGGLDRAHILGLCPTHQRRRSIEIEELRRTRQNRASTPALLQEVKNRKQSGSRPLHLDDLDVLNLVKTTDHSTLCGHALNERSRHDGCLSRAHVRPVVAARFPTRRRQPHRAHHPEYRGGLMNQTDISAPTAKETAMDDLRPHSAEPPSHHKHRAPSPDVTRSAVAEDRRWTKAWRL